MISWFERHNKLSWTITIIIAVMIFYISSIEFESGVPGGGINIYAILYHIIAFFFLALFLSISMVKGKSTGLFFLVIILTITYGISDELHQFFVPGRNTSVSDVLLDSVGIVFAIISYFIYIEYRKRITKTFS